MNPSRNKASTSIASLQREMRRLLDCRSDPTYLEFIVTSIGVRDRVIGVRVPEIRAAVKQFLTSHREFTIDAAVALLDAAARSRVREELLFATFALVKFRRHFDASMLAQIDTWIEALDNWETCDQLALNVAAVIISRDITHAERLYSWSHSKNPWRRRFALATAAALNQKGRQFPMETLKVCLPVLDDPDPQVRKAVGWAIREASDSDEPAAFAFLREHREDIHPTVLREAGRKLTRAHQSELFEQAGPARKSRR